MTICVVIDQKNPFEKQMRKFKKLCNGDGLFWECERRRYFVKKSDRKRGKAMLKKAFNK